MNFKSEIYTKINHKDYLHIKEEFFSLIEYLNDMLSIDYAEFKQFLLNTIASYFVLPLLRDLLINSQSSFMSQSECILVLYLFVGKIKSDEVKKMVIKFLLKPEVDQRLNEIDLLAFKAPYFYSFNYTSKELLNHKTDNLIPSQLELVYEKTRNLKLDTNVSWVQELMKKPVEHLKGLTINNLKTWHKHYTKLTGIISYYGWEKELASYQAINPLNIINSTIEGQTHRNNLSTLFYQMLLVGLTD